VPRADVVGVSGLEDLFCVRRATRDVPLDHIVRCHIAVPVVLICTV
jgi:hypothetical protein